MCGIAGFMPLPNRRSERTRHPDQPGDVVGRMVDELIHRGPDGHGVELLSCGSSALDGGRVAAFGHTRLAILDLSDSGRQPMVDSTTGNCITFNGEIYNFLALRTQFERGVGESGALAFRSRTDTEVILRAYARWGRECVHQLRGMFAFGL